jgi:D-alanyl-D-alanine carboxypeptidase (penicillin-binding protein 5/6)
MIGTTSKLLKERRVVVVFQITILAFILVGLFNAYFKEHNQTANVATPANLDTAPLKQPNTEVPQKLKEVTVRGKAAYVWDIQNQRVLYAKNESDVLPLASITKLMTALLAYELTDPQKAAVISSRALGQDGSSGLSEGEQLTIKELNKLALVASSNDAAFALGAAVGALLGNKDPTTQFVAGMNVKADELKLSSLKFKNTTGLDLSPTEPGAVGSAKDISFLMEYILKNHPELLEATTHGGARVYDKNGDYHDIENTNEILYAIPNLLGSKTGYTDLAGGNLTIAFDAGMNRPIVVTVLGSTREERFSDVLRLVHAVQRNINEI